MSPVNVVPLRRPMLARDPHEQHRAATPLELFFDLVFVVAIASAAMMVWFRPTTIVERAIGSCTLVSRCQKVWPAESVASMVVGETVRMPWPAILINGGSA